MGSIMKIVLCLSLLFSLWKNSQVAAHGPKHIQVPKAVSEWVDVNAPVDIYVHLLMS